MKEVFTKYKVIIILGIIIVLIGVVFGINILMKDEDKSTTNNNNTNEVQAVVSKYTSYVQINPLVKLEFEVSCKKDICTEPSVTGYELVNDDAKEIYKDLEFKGKELKDAVNTLINKAKDAGIKFDDVAYYSDWNNNEYFKDEVYNDYLKVVIDDKEKLDDLIQIEVPKNKYTISFDSNGGTNIQGQEIEEGQVVNQPQNPTRKNYEFVEWQLNGKKYDFNNPITQNITLKALWKEVKNDSNVSKPNPSPSPSPSATPTPKPSPSPSPSITPEPTPSATPAPSPSPTPTPEPTPTPKPVTYNFVGKYIATKSYYEEIDEYEEYKSPGDEYIILNSNSTYILYYSYSNDWKTEGIYKIKDCDNPTSCETYPTSILLYENGSSTYTDVLGVKSNYELLRCAMGDNISCTYSVYTK